MQEKLKWLHKLKHELKQEEHYLGCYTQGLPKEQITYAMEIADLANQKAYESKKKMIDAIEKELLKRNELITLRMVIPHYTAGTISLSAFNELTAKYQKALKEISDDYKKKYRKKLGKIRNIDTDLTLYAFAPGSFCAYLGKDRDPNDLFQDDEKARTADLCFQFNTQLLHILMHADSPETIEEEIAPLTDTTLYTIKSIYEEINDKNMTLDISWNQHPDIHPFTIPYDKAITYSIKLEQYIQERQKKHQEKTLTGHFLSMNVESCYFRFRTAKPCQTQTIYFHPEKQDTLRRHGVDPLNPQEYTIRTYLKEFTKKGTPKWYLLEFIDEE